MTLIEQLQFIAASLAEWAKTNKGQVIIGSDPTEVFARLTGKPGGATAFVLYQGTETLDDYESGCMARRTFLVIVSRGRGLTIDPADNVLKGVSGGPALYTLIESAIEVVRAMEFTPGIAGWGTEDQEREADNSEIVPLFKGDRAWRGNADYPLDAHEIEFSVTVQLPGLDA